MKLICISLVIGSNLEIAEQLRRANFALRSLLDVSNDKSESSTFFTRFLQATESCRDLYQAVEPLSRAVSQHEVQMRNLLVSLDVYFDNIGKQSVENPLTKTPMRRSARFFPNLRSVALSEPEDAELILQNLVNSEVEALTHREIENCIERARRTRTRPVPSRHTMITRDALNRVCHVEKILGTIRHDIRNHVRTLEEANKHFETFGMKGKLDKRIKKIANVENDGIKKIKESVREPIKAILKAISRLQHEERNNVKFSYM